MAIYAIPETARIAGSIPYLTPGKRYHVTTSEALGIFYVVDDVGDMITCKWVNCLHGGNWTRVEVDDEDDSVIVTRPAAPADEPADTTGLDEDDSVIVTRPAAPADEPADTTGLDLTGSETLKLVPAGNGGWVVYRVEAPHLHDPMIGAYSSAEEMCAALTEALA